jgi:ABC-type uncharacterized transport system substrate-binding protein
MSGKWLEALKEIAPSVRQVDAINQAENVTGAGYLRALESAALAMGVELIAAHVRDAADIERAIATASQSNGGLIILPSPLALVNRELIVKLAAQHRLPAVYPFRYFVASGGLMSYGVERLRSSGEARCTSIVSSRARSPRRYRCSSRRSSSWSSTFPPPGPSVSKSYRRCSLAPTR